MDADRSGLAPGWIGDDAGARFGLAGYDAATYGESFADVYDEWYEDLDDDDFVDRLRALLPDRPARILELGVGTGRLAAKVLAGRAGDAFTGVDSSTAMVERARERLGAAATLVIADFSADLPGGTFDLVFVGYNTLFNLPDDEALASCLRLVSSRLAPGGHFLIDVASPPPSDPHGGGDVPADHVEIRSMTSASVVLSVSRHDPQRRRIIGHFVEYAQDERVRLRPWSVRYWHPRELDGFASGAGLELQSRTGEDPVARGDGAETPTGGRHISHYRAPTGILDAQ